jgi:hypothetical protein
MADQTPTLHLPYIMPSQAQKHVTHNQALEILDAVVQLSVIDADTSSPPPSPEEGDRHIVGPSATGAWDGHETEVAVARPGGWIFVAPITGWLAWVQDAERLVIFDGDAWISVAESAFNPTPLVGVNATADLTNRLAVSSEASLFSHSGDDHRLKINKAAAGDTASILLQSGFSGRAELGLAGDNSWRLKTSADGASWSEAIHADPAGHVSFPSGVVHAPTGAALRGLIFTPGGDGQISIYRNDTGRPQNPRSATLASVSGDVVTFSTNAASLFFHAFMRDVSLVRIWNLTRSPQQSAWVKWDPAVNQVRVTNAAHVAGWLAGDTIQLGDPTVVTPVRSIAIDISPMMQNVLGTVFAQSGIVLKGAASGTTAVGLFVSATGTSGSFSGINSATSGALSNETVIVPSSVASPVSAANLLFLREDGDMGTALGVCLLSVVGLLA